jgi:hypothetical protein
MICTFTDHFFFVHLSPALSFRRGRSRKQRESRADLEKYSHSVAF